MGTHGQRWRTAADGHFGFLEGEGFDRVDVDDSSWWETSVTYLAEAVAVKVGLSNEFGRVEVDLIRLIDGRVPQYPIWITEDPIHWASLDMVVKARRPDLLEEHHRRKGLYKRAADEQLALCSRSLRDVAPDFLSGNTSAIDEAAALTRAAVAQQPHGVTVYLPVDTSEDEAAAKAAFMAALVPVEVGVRVAAYERPRRRGWLHRPR